jgi:hypothetical protein
MRWKQIMKKNYYFHYDLKKVLLSLQFAKNNIIEYGTFDFIIIGGGSTGSVIANRLSKVKNWDILLLEAGLFGTEVNDIPNMAWSFYFSGYNWAYESIPQISACLGTSDYYYFSYLI